MKIFKVGLLAIYFSSLGVHAQDKAIVNTSKSKYVKLYSVSMSEVTWTKGFWADRFKVATEPWCPIFGLFTVAMTK